MGNKPQITQIHLECDNRVVAALDGSTGNDMVVALHRPMTKGG